MSRHVCPGERLPLVVLPAMSSRPAVSQTMNPGQGLQLHSLPSVVVFAAQASSEEVIQPAKTADPASLATPSRLQHGHPASLSRVFCKRAKRHKKTPPLTARFNSIFFFSPLFHPLHFRRTHAPEPAVLSAHGLRANGVGRRSWFHPSTEGHFVRPVPLGSASGWVRGATRVETNSYQATKRVKSRFSGRD